jgi:hypothetical protein
MTGFQVWLVQTLSSATAVSRLMHTAWGWPIAESLHFIGLSLLIGTVGVFDLRLIGIGRRIPLRTLHRLIPWGLAGFAMNMTTGLMFLMTEPDQYIYNPSFHVKMVCIAAAGLNAAVFYLTVGRRALAADAPLEAPRAARMIGGISLALWISVIIAGRLLTFYRPFECEPDRPAEMLLTCSPQDGSLVR